MYTPNNKKRPTSVKISVTEIDVGAASNSPAPRQGQENAPVGTPKAGSSTPQIKKTLSRNGVSPRGGMREYSPEEIRSALTEFYKKHDATKLQTVDNFVAWIDSNGLLAFNDLLYIKYGGTLPIGGCSASDSPLKPLEVSFSSSTLAEAFREIASSNLTYLVLSVVGFLIGYLYIYGHLALANLLLAVAGMGVTVRHLKTNDRTRVVSSVLYVFWPLIAFSFLLESVLPESLRQRWEYTFLKCVLFGYLYLPDRMLKEQRGRSMRPVIKVQLVTVLRDLLLFCIEAVLLFFFTRHDGILHRYQALCLVLIAVAYMYGTRSLRRRDLVVEELFTSEAQYAAHLGVFKTTYVPALSKVVSSEEIELLTRHLESIVTLSELFSNELRMAMSRDRVGPAVEKFVPFLQMYAPYCADYEAKREILGRLKERKEVAEAIEQTLSTRTVDDAKVQTIESYLIMPVQRVPRYVLLLSEIIKQTPKWHFDLDRCTRALEQVEGVARFIDAAIEARASGKALPVSPVNRFSARLNIARTNSTSSTTSASA